MKWYTVDEAFLDYLRHHENRIPRTNYGPDKFKPFFGELFSIGDLVYITQVSHPQARHFSMREDVDFYKLYHGNRLIGVVNLNYMFPVYRSKLIEVKYGDIENFRTFETIEKKNSYISLMRKEMRAILSKNLDVSAQNLYIRKYDYPNDRISMRCIDFKDLEQKCIEYNTKPEIKE